MNAKEAIKIIKDEKLQGYNMNEERHNRENEVVLRCENDKWIVYATDERASKVTNSQFVAHIILYQPKEWKMFSCSLKQKHLSFSKRK